MKFNAKSILLKKERDKWVDKVKTIKSADDILNIFEGKEVTQVNISKYQKIYYSIDNLSIEGQVQAKVIDAEDEMHYMASPLLLVECDDFKPINISSTIEKTLREAIDFC